LLVEKIGLKILYRKARPVFEFYSLPIAIQCFEDNTYVESYSDGGTRHTGQGLNPLGSEPFKPQWTWYYPNGTSSADGVMWNRKQDQNKLRECA
jgi:hypothetical protein